MDMSLVEPYQKVCYVELETGYIVWRRGTGDNIELLHLQAFVHRQGIGRLLVRTMLDKLKDDPPADTVFGFTRISLLDAVAFYHAMGFETTVVKGLYTEGVAVMFSQTYEKLLELHKLKDPV